MDAFLESLIARSKEEIMTVVLPEGDDERTLQAAEAILEHGIANLIILGDVDEIAASGYKLDGARLIDHRTSDLREGYAEYLYELRKHKGVTPEKLWNCLITSCISAS